MCGYTSVVVSVISTLWISTCSIATSGSSSSSASSAGATTAAAFFLPSFDFLPFLAIYKHGTTLVCYSVDECSYMIYLLLLNRIVLNMILYWFDLIAICYL